MKRKDIALFAVVGVVSAVLSMLISNLFISAPKNRQQKYTVVSKITSDFNLPDPTYINTQSVDPTRLIKIGGSSNSDPFAAH